MTRIAKSAHTSQKSQALLAHSNGWTNDIKSLHVINKYGAKQQKRLLDACENIWKLSPNLGLTKESLYDICLFMETKLKHKVKQGNFYLKKEKTALSRTIEYDPKSRQTFIHLKTHDIPPIGKGTHKVVTLSIMYKVHSPELVANCVGTDESLEQEAKILKKLKNKNGLPTTYAITSHRKGKSQEKVTSIIQKLYAGRSIRSFRKRCKLCSEQDFMIIARDLMHGLERLHKLHLAHRDLHYGNMLIDSTLDPNTQKMHVAAALIDLGQVISFKKARKLAPRIEVPHRLASPEVLRKHKSHLDVGRVEVFAAGINLYHMFFKVDPEWGNHPSLYRVSNYNHAQKKHFRKVLTRDIKKIVHLRHIELEKHTDAWSKFGRLILQMCHPNPKKRDSAHQMRKKLDRLIQQVSP